MQTCLFLLEYIEFERLKLQKLQDAFGWRRLINLKRYISIIQKCSKMWSNSSRATCYVAYWNHPIELRLYTLLLIPKKSLERVSMDFLGGLSSTRGDHGYLFVIVDWFSKMVGLIPYKKIVIEKKATHLLFPQKFWSSLFNNFKSR